MEMTKEAQREALKRKLDKCVQTGTITRSSGKVTDFYFDGRLVSLEPEGSVLIAELFLELLQRDGIQAVGGLTSGADPLTSSVGVLAHQQGVDLRLFYVRKESKSHGTQKRIEGPPLPAGFRTALVDDVLTTGGSLLEARNALRDEAGAATTHAYVVIDRDEGGRERLAAEGIEVHSLFQRGDFLS